MSDLTEDEWADIVTTAFATGSEDYVGRPNRVYTRSFIQTYSKAVEGPIFSSYDVKKVLFERNIFPLLVIMVTFVVKHSKPTRS